MDDATVRAWLDLSLVQREQGAAAHTVYTIHPVVHESLLAQQGAEERQALHRWAAASYKRRLLRWQRRGERLPSLVSQYQRK